MRNVTPYIFCGDMRRRGIEICRGGKPEYAAGVKFERKDWNEGEGGSGHVGRGGLLCGGIPIKRTGL